MNKNKQKGKQLRKPISNNFAPKRLAINFDPPMIIMEYLVVDTGKLYHHKMRLDSLFKKSKLSRDDVLNYIKTKHHLYFVNGKVKDAQLCKFIDKILLRKGYISKADMGNLQSIQQPVSQKESSQKNNVNEQDDFEYLNDQEQQQYYDQDYQDYEDPSNFVHEKKEEKNTKVSSNAVGQKKNAFLAYCQQYEDGQDDDGAQASWDLDMDQNDDFV